METRGTLLEALGIEIISVARDRVEATMPVDERTIQPFGYLHGGATAALLETVASLGSLGLIDANTQGAFGVELCVRHVKSAREGVVRGVATPAELQDHKHVWNVEALDEAGEVLSTGTCTVRIVPL